MKTKDEIINELDHFTGTENYYRMHHNTLLTDGVKYLCEECKAFWLMDVIWSYLPQVPVDEYFLVVKFDVRDEDGRFWMGDDVPPAHVDIMQEIGFTDFPLDSITLYVSRMGDKWVIMLNSEY